MGSLVPFQDLNLPPQNPNSNPNNPSPNPSNLAIIVPKIEPKLEPLDDYPTYIQNPSSIDDNPSSNGTEFDALNGLMPVQNGGEESGESGDVYAQFARISELFKSAFASRRAGDMEVLSPGGGGGVAGDWSIVPREENRGAVVVATAVARKMKNVRSSEMELLGAGGGEGEEFRGGGEEDEGDLRAATAMKDRGLWLNRDKRIIGAIPGVYVGDIFFFRMELCVIGLHGQVQAGIDYVPAGKNSNREPIATSIIVSGGYEDDEDGGDVLVYTGHGGQMRNSSKQCVHQKLEGGNLALERSMYYEIEIRVIRGIRHEGGPTSRVYVYDGLYRVTDSWFDIGKSGFGVYKYRLVRMADQPEMGSTIFRYAMSLKRSPLSVRPSGYLTLDLSKGKERSPVSLFNDIDSNNDPMLFDYLAKPIYPLFAIPQVKGIRGCECVSSCSDGCYCVEKNGGEFPYDHSGILLKGKSLIHECGIHCRCPPTCRNRVTQNGVKYQLEVFRSRETGWGVRPLDLIPAGAFICEYTGLVLSRQQATILSMNGDCLVYPSRFAKHWVEWGDVSRVYPGVPQSRESQYPPLDFAMDVSRTRNVACYFSHSPCPNVLVQHVLYDHDSVYYPHLALFAMENIPPFRELSLDYGVTDEWTGKLALCN
ncbi:hypothetical protein Syun_030115 [Stephania yunnanensis]|uniref:Uncharacterized protein n=1 Tax=Stephania yunnanensis TaxID=152371 RepID=A0AAP0HKI2_9MAGN